MSMTDVQGIDALLPEPPPLVAPPLSLLDMARTLIDNEGDVAELREAQDAAGSAQERAAAIAERQRNSGAGSDELDRLQREAEEVGGDVVAAEAWMTDVRKRLAATERWERGFLYLPELGRGALSVFVEDDVRGPTPADAGALKPTGSNQLPFAWYDPFGVEARDERSMFPPRSPVTSFEARAQRAERAERAHEAWECEEEFWSGKRVPTNWHLTASPDTPLDGPRRTLTGAWPLPSACPGTVLGVPVGLTQALAALDQSIAEASAGTGMIHCTPYMAQQLMRTFPYIRASNGWIYTVNMNLIVPGYGYPGTGPDRPSRVLTDGVFNDTATLHSPAGAFTDNDIGSSVSDAAGNVPDGTFIVSITDGTHAVLSAPVPSHSAENVTVGGAAPGRLGGYPLEWAYATEMVYKCRGDVQTYPSGYEQGSPDVTVDNSMAVRKERPWALITNRILRAAVLVDTTQQ